MEAHVAMIYVHHHSKANQAAKEHWTAAVAPGHGAEIRTPFLIWLNKNTPLKKKEF
jgi:RecA-family ATPase